MKVVKTSMIASTAQSRSSFGRVGGKRGIFWVDMVFPRDGIVYSEVFSWMYVSPVRFRELCVAEGRQKV
jgi:hypothetical protein